MKDIGILTLMRAIMALGLICGLGESATAATLTFNDQPAGSIGNGGSFTEGAFTITSNPTGDAGNYVTIYDDGGTNVLVDGSPSDVFGTLAVITLTGGGLFDVQSLDVGNLDGGGPVSVGCGGGFRIEVTSSLPGCADYGPGPGPFTTETLNITGVSFLDVNLVSLTQEGLDYAVNNIVVNAESSVSGTPEPTTLLLGIAGLTGLAARRRFRRA